MADPQLENGYTKIAHEIVEALCRINLYPYESRVLWFIFRKTYGWNKKVDRVPLSQFARGLNLDRRLVHRTIERLLAKNMIIRTGNSNSPSYGFQKDYEKWEPPVIYRDDKDVICADDKKGQSVICRDDEVSSVEIPSKDNTKERTLYSSVKEIFAYWQEVMNHPRSKLTDDRKQKIKARLNEGYSVEDIKKATDGCKASSHHMGQNEQQTIYDDLELICRKGSKLEFFMQKADGNQGLIMQHKLKQALEAGRWGNLPSMEELEAMHIQGLIEKQADIANDLGMYRRMLENPELRDDNRVLLHSLIVLDDKRYWALDLEIEELQREQKDLNQRTA